MYTVQQVLRKQPHLRIVNINNVSDRLMARTDGTCFIAYNTFNGLYELHSTLSFDHDRNSCNAVIDKSWLNWHIVEDFLANNHKKFGQELHDTREYQQAYFDKAEEKRQFAMTTGRMGIIKRTLGRTV